jgi:Histidine kinase-, DNA gyrase B-, and HSP90-like ATPase
MLRLSVAVREDHLRRLVTTDPLAGILELIWNGLDAEAQNVSVSVVENALGGVDQVLVNDDGHGMTFEAARSGFSALGGSWKLNSHRSLNGRRILHGREGKGRWRVFAIGDEVTWESIAEQPDGSRARIVLQGVDSSLGEFDLSEPTSSSASLGTKVSVQVGGKTPSRLLADDVADQLTARLALYLEQYPEVTVTYRNERLNPQLVQMRRDQYPLEVGEIDEPVDLVVIEWSRPIDRALYLCDENGTTLEKTDTRIQAPGFEFTAYVRWAGFRRYESELSVADMGHPSLAGVVEAARDQLRTHFKNRQAEESNTLVEVWKAENVYPYEGEPRDNVERAERDLFDIVAVTAAPAVNAAADRSSRKLSLSLLKQALSEDPGALQHILSEVLELPPQRLEELSQLLRKTTLTAVITAAKRIADRLEFLAGLELLVFDPKSKEQLLERSQLHRILAAETWLFGEEFALAADDQSLTTVLAKHVAILDRNELAAENPVLDEQGKPRIVDLMLARSMAQARNQREHLVIELKRPRTRIGPDEITQIKNYAFTVAKDERFSKTDVQWDFVVVSNEMTGYAEQEASQQGKEPGLISDTPGIRVWIRTWGEVIETSKHRLKFVQEHLQYEPDRDAALAYLRKVHEKYLPQALSSSAVGQSPNGSTEFGADVS